MRPYLEKAKGLVEWLKMWALSSSLNTAKKKKLEYVGVQG
jgi:hypothetical protein